MFYLSSKYIKSSLSIHDHSGSKKDSSCYFLGEHFHDIWYTSTTKIMSDQCYLHAKFEVMHIVRQFNIKKKFELQKHIHIIQDSCYTPVIHLRILIFHNEEYFSCMELMFQRMYKIVLDICMNNMGLTSYMATSFSNWFLLQTIQILKQIFFFFLKNT